MTDILTDIPGKPGRFWGDNTIFVGPNQPPAWLLRLAGKRWAYNLTGLLAGLRMFARRRHCQGVVTDGGSSGMLFAWLQALCPWGRKPHVLDRLPLGTVRIAIKGVVQEAAYPSGGSLGASLRRLGQP